MGTEKKAFAQELIRLQKVVVQKIKVRHRFARRLCRQMRRRLVFGGALLLLRSRWRVARILSNISMALGVIFSSLVGLLVAVVCVFVLPNEAIGSSDWKAAEVHLVSAAILGTALALVLTLSTVPAQRAAEAFSAAILKLYSRDPRTHVIFGLLAVLTLFSLMFGTNWVYGSCARYGLAVQFVILGIGLDALRAFYRRTLDLLVPATALSLVKADCRRIIWRTKRQVEQLARVHRLHDSNSSEDRSINKWILYNRLLGPNLLVGWVHQLEEFAHKAVARRDTQAANEIIATLVSIGASYADSRRDSLVVTHDFSSLMPMPVSDVGRVLNPIYESLKNICDDAARQPNEAIVLGCIRAFGQMAVHALTMIHVEEHGGQSVPLAHSPVFYLDLCTQYAIKAGMDDAQLNSVQAIGEIFGKMRADVRSREMEATAIDCLKKIALASYPRQSTVVGFRAVEMLLIAAHQELRVCSVRHPLIVEDVLRHIIDLVPFEVAMEKAGQRVLQTLPAYALGFASNIPNLLAEVAHQVKPVDPERAWIDPFSDFEEVSKEIVRHYRKVAESVDFDGVLLQKWVLDSILTAAEIHLRLLADPPPGAEPFLETVDNRLQWYIWTPAYFFSKDKQFSPGHAAEASGRLAIMGMELMQLNRLEAAKACAETIVSIGNEAFRAKDRGAWPAAEIFVHLDVLARAAEVLGFPEIVELSRAAIAKPAKLPEVARPEFEKAIAIRSQQLDERLQERRRERYFSMRSDPVILLRKILAIGCGAD